MSPPDSAQLDAYVHAAMDDHEAERFEDELFEAAAAGTARALILLDRLVAGFDELGERGTLAIYATRSELEALRARYGSRLEIVDISTSGVTHLEIPRRAELWATRMRLGLRDVERVDLEIGFEGGPTVKTIEDVPLDPETGDLIVLCEAELARHAVGPPVWTRMWTRTPAGARLLAEFTVHVTLER